MLHGAGHVAHIAGHAPEKFLYLCAGAQVKKSEAEPLEGLLSDLERVVPVLVDARRVDFVPDIVEFGCEFMRVFAQNLVIVPDRQLCGLEHLDYQHRMVRGERASALGDYVRMRKVILLADIH